MERVRTESVAPFGDSSVRFRLADPSDREALTGLCAAYRSADGQPEAPEHVASAIDAILSGDPLVRVYMIELIEESDEPSEHASMLVGYVAITMGFSIEAGGRDAFIDELYIRPSVQRHGLGRRALEFAENVCREQDVKRVCLEVEHRNEGAKQLYDQLGYREHQRHLLSKRL